MFLVVSFTVLSTIAVLIYVRWTQVRQYWAKRKVAYLPPHPVMGNITFLRKQNPTEWIKELYSHFKEPYMGIWLLWRPVLVVNSPEIAKTILIKDNAFFRNRYVQTGSSDRIGSLLFFTLNDNLWSNFRKRLTFTFTGAKFRGMQNLFKTKSEQLIQRIERERQKPEVVDTRVLYTDFTTDITGEAFFGVACDATLTGEGAMRDVTKGLMEFNIWRGLCWFSTFFYPELVDILRVKMFSDRTLKIFTSLCKQIIDQRGGYAAKVAEPRDLLDILIKIKQEDNSNEYQMSEDMLVAQAITFVLAGFDTTATSISFCIYELAHNPAVQEKLFQELHEAQETYGDGVFDSNVLSKLTYLNCVINEELRKFPVMGWLDRIAKMDYKIDDHLTVTAGTPVYVNAIGMHYDPEKFPDPYTFNPDRFLPENQDNIKPFTFLPFGDGPRKCIGERFARTSTRFAVASVILKYEVRAIPNTPRPSEVKLDVNGLFLAPGEKISVDYVPRK